MNYSKGVTNSDRMKLIDSLAKRDLTIHRTPEERADSIIARIEDALSFMENNNIYCTSFMYEIVPGMQTLIVKSEEEYFMDFYLSKNQYLRYYHISASESKSYPNDVIEAKWIDSSWVYLRKHL